MRGIPQCEEDGEEGVSALHRAVGGWMERDSL